MQAGCSSYTSSLPLLLAISCAFCSIGFSASSVNTSISIHGLLLEHFSPQLQEGAAQALMAQVAVVLDAVQLHYHGMMTHTHELHMPAIAALFHELLLLPPMPLQSEGAGGAGNGNTTHLHLNPAASPAGNNSLPAFGADQLQLGGTRLMRVLSEAAPQTSSARPAHTQHSPGARRHRGDIEAMRQQGTAAGSVHDDAGDGNDSDGLDHESGGSQREPGSAGSAVGAAGSCLPSSREALEDLGKKLGIDPVKVERLAHTPDRQQYHVPLPLPARLSAIASPASLEEWAERLWVRLLALPPSLSYPITRRLLVAVVLRAWLLRGPTVTGGDGASAAPAAAGAATASSSSAGSGGGGAAPGVFSNAEERALSRLFAQLYRLHRRGAATKGIMEFAHVSKSGGTSWCLLAGKNGCKRPTYNRRAACRVRAFDDQVRWLDPHFHLRSVGRRASVWARFGTLRACWAPQTCAGRAALLAAYGVTYTSNEYTQHGGRHGWPGARVCPQVHTAMLLRHPLSRLESNLRFVMHRYHLSYRNETLFNATFGAAGAQWWNSFGPSITNNFYIRNLLGEAVYHARPGSLGPQHLAAARLVLLQFDTLMLLEASQEHNTLLLRMGTGWLHPLHQVHAYEEAALSERDHFDPKPFLPQPDQMAALREQQALDLQLYDTADLLFKLDAVVFGAAAATGMQPWPGADDAQALGGIRCGLFRGPGGSWAASVDAAEQQQQQQGQLQQQLQQHGQQLQQGEPEQAQQQEERQEERPQQQ